MLAMGIILHMPYVVKINYGFNLMMKEDQYYLKKICFPKTIKKSIVILLYELQSQHNLKPQYSNFIDMTNTLSYNKDIAIHAIPENLLPVKEIEQSSNEFVTKIASMIIEKFHQFNLYYFVLSPETFDFQMKIC